MAKTHYDEASVIRSLSRKNSVHINSVNKTIEVVKDNNDVGNGSWGKIDYLTKIHNYVVLFVSKLGKSKSSKKFNEEDYQSKSNKTAKREAKINMATMAKSAMKRAKTK